MPLKKQLFKMILTHTCPHCGHKLRRKGSWFATKSMGYRCPACDRDVEMNYSTKIALFDSHSPSSTREAEEDRS